VGIHKDHLRIFPFSAEKNAMWIGKRFFKNAKSKTLNLHPCARHVYTAFLKHNVNFRKQEVQY
jgi:hypothetical protein